MGVKHVQHVMFMVMHRKTLREWRIMYDGRTLHNRHPKLEAQEMPILSLSLLSPLSTPKHNQGTEQIFQAYALAALTAFLTRSARAFLANMTAKRSKSLNDRLFSTAARF